MHKFKLTALLAIASASTFAQQASTDIYIVDYGVKDGNYYFNAPVNITHRPGYDNQPSFSPDAGKVYYTSYHDTIQSDIYVYDLNDTSTTQITQSAESEYSPRLAKDQMGLNIIRVDADRGQRFYKILLDGTDPIQLVSSTDSAAYYAWVNDSTIAMAVLNGGKMDLNVYTLPLEQFIPLATNVGRCIASIPGSGDDEFSYVDKSDTNGFIIMRFGMELGQISSVTTLPKGVEDYAWLNNGKLVCGIEGKLYLFDPETPARGWYEINDMSQTVGNFYRITASPVSNTLALVAYKDDLNKKSVAKDKSAGEADKDKKEGKRKKRKD